MYPNAPGAVLCALVDAIHSIDNRLNPLAAEFIAKNIQADFFIGCIKGSDGGRDAFHGAGIAEGLP